MAFSRHPTILRQLSMRFYISSKLFSSRIRTFEEARVAVDSMKNEPANPVMLRIYGLFKQAILGDCNVSQQPSGLNFVANAKWQAWNSLKSMSKEDASAEYVNIVSELSAKEEETGSYQGTELTKGIRSSLGANGVMQIYLDRPEKKNAITPEMYGCWTRMLNEAAVDSNIKVVSVTGVGDYFSSGNDLNTLVKFLNTGIPITELADKFRVILLEFVSALIDFPKPLVALINGPAIGITCTTLGLYDYVLADVDHASFHTPFVNLGLTPEGCSSVTFPQIMGPIRAKEMLLFGKRLTAMEAQNCGLVTRVVSKADFPSESMQLTNVIADFPAETVLYSKQLLQSTNQQLLHITNLMECNRLTERWASSECLQAVTKFFQKPR